MQNTLGLISPVVSKRYVSWLEAYALFAVPPTKGGRRLFRAWLAERSVYPRMTTGLLAREISAIFVGWSGDRPWANY